MSQNKYIRYQQTSWTLLGCCREQSESSCLSRGEDGTVTVSVCSSVCPSRLLVLPYLAEWGPRWESQRSPMGWDNWELGDSQPAIPSTRVPVKMNFLLIRGHISKRLFTSPGGIFYAKGRSFQASSSKAFKKSNVQKHNGHRGQFVNTLLLANQGDRCLTKFDAVNRNNKLMT